MRDRTALKKKEWEALAVAGVTFAGGFAALYGGLFIAARVVSGLWSVVVFFLGGFVFLFLLRMADVINVERNKLRQDWLREGARLDRRPPLLLLRPFADSDLGFTPRTQGKGGLTVKGHPYAHTIARELARHGSVITIGTIEEESRSAKGYDALFFESSDQDWETMFRLAASAARAIVLVPGDTPGVVEEISTLLRGELWPKVVLFMPPSPKGFNRMHSHWWTVPDRWARVRDYWKEQGLLLPEYRKEGAFIVCTPEGEEKASVSLQNDLALSRLGDRMAALLDTMAGPSQPTSEVLLALEEVERVAKLRRVEELKAKLAAMKRKREERAEELRAKLAERKRKREADRGDGLP
jgi:hypothetical protein